jgi:hypothetical protein
LPYFVLQDLINLKYVSTNAAYSQYRNYFIAFGYFTVIPVGIVSIFGYLSYRHVHRQHLQEGQRPLPRLATQMASMSLFQIINVLAISTPFVTTQAYFLVSATFNKDASRQAQEQLAHSISHSRF